MTVVGSHNFHSAATSASVGEVWNCGYLLTKAIAIQTAGFTGKIRFQGSFDNNNWSAIAYKLQGQDGEQVPTNDDLSFVVHTGFVYLKTKEIWPFVRANILERNIGVVTIKGFGTEN